MKIEKIIKKPGNKYILELDNGDKIKTYDEVILKYGILFHKEIDNDTLEQLVNENNYYDVYEKVLKYINTKMRSEYEIRGYLKKLEYNDIDNLVNDLKTKKLINDELFIKAYINDRILLTLDGPYKIKNNLLEHNIDESLINQELVFDNELINERLKKIIDKKIKLNKKPLYTFKQKMLGYLINMGYSKEDILNILDTYKINEEELIKKDYETLKKKLSKKHEEKGLEYQIKNKLYQKGYSIDSINKFLSE